MTDLLVTGAAGQFGRAVLGHLLDTLAVPASRITAATRKPDSLAEWAGRGVTVVEADFNRPETLSAAFKGVKRLLVISTDSLGEEGERLRQHKNAVAAASEAGVEHIVYTSLPYADRSAVSFAPDHFGTEEAIKASGISGWSILRNDWYAENLLMSLPQALASGTWYSAAADGKIAYIPRADLALAAATALASDSSDRRTLTLAGSRGYTSEDVAALARAVTGKPLKIVPVPLEGLVQGMIGAGLPAPVARTVASFDAAAAAGHLDATDADFRALTGRSPTSLEHWFETVGAGSLKG